MELCRCSSSSMKTAMLCVCLLQACVVLPSTVTTVIIALSREVFRTNVDYLCVCVCVYIIIIIVAWSRTVAPLRDLWQHQQTIALTGGFRHLRELDPPRYVEVCLDKVNENYYTFQYAILKQPLKINSNGFCQNIQKIRMHFYAIVTYSLLIS